MLSPFAELKASSHAGNTSSMHVEEFRGSERTVCEANFTGRPAQDDRHPVNDPEEYSDAQDYFIHEYPCERSNDKVYQPQRSTSTAKN